MGDRVREGLDFGMKVLAVYTGVKKCREPVLADCFVRRDITRKSRHATVDARLTGGDEGRVRLPVHDMIRNSLKRIAFLLDRNARDASFVRDRLRSVQFG